MDPSSINSNPSPHYSSSSKVLRAETFVSKDKQLRVIHLILNFKPLFNKFQDVDHAIKAGDP